MGVRALHHVTTTSSPTLPQPSSSSSSSTTATTGHLFVADYQLKITSSAGDIRKLFKNPPLDGTTGTAKGDEKPASVPKSPPASVLSCAPAAVVKDTVAMESDMKKSPELISAAMIKDATETDILWVVIYSVPCKICLSFSCLTWMSVQLLLCLKFHSIRLLLFHLPKLSKFQSSWMSWPTISFFSIPLIIFQAIHSTLHLHLPHPMKCYY